MDYSRVRVQVFVPEMEVPFITNGLPASVSVEELPGRSFAGSVTRFAHALDETTKTMLAEIELPNPDGALRPGMYAACGWRWNESRTPGSCRRRRCWWKKPGTSVFVADGGKAKKTPVRTGFNDGTNAEIVNGVQAGQPVIVLGKQTLNDGQPVTVVESK